MTVITASLRHLVTSSPGRLGDRYQPVTFVHHLAIIDHLVANAGDERDHLFILGQDVFDLAGQHPDLLLDHIVVRFAGLIVEHHGLRPA